MPDNNLHNINYEQIAQEYKENLQRLDAVEKPSEREIIESIVKKKVEEAATLSKATQPSPSLTPQNVSSEVFPSYALSAEEDVKEKVKKLIEITLEKGISAGVRLALKENDPYLLDLYHDALVEKVLDELKRRELI
ncbi:MAG: hypothetical protein N2Z68_01025 [Patescibacteria group bacterium]|nr:hypothetical protein [Patescibacteria group bacterium]